MDYKTFELVVVCPKASEDAKRATAEAIVDKNDSLKAVWAAAGPNAKAVRTALVTIEMSKLEGLGDEGGFAQALQAIWERLNKAIPELRGYYGAKSGYKLVCEVGKASSGAGRRSTEKDPEYAKLLAEFGVKTAKELAEKLAATGRIPRTSPCLKQPKQATILAALHPKTPQG